MTETQNIPWKRITVEAAAIVGSILLAFAIDAWWNDHQNRAEERRVLVGLKSEFEQNLELIDIEISSSLFSALMHHLVRLPTRWQRDDPAPGRR
jgi:hypothetical protein